MISRMEVVAIFLVIVSASCHPVVVNNRTHPAPNVENIDWKVIWLGNLAMQKTLERHERLLLVGLVLRFLLRLVLGERVHDGRAGLAHEGGTVLCGPVA